MNPVEEMSVARDLTDEVLSASASQTSSISAGQPNPHLDYLVAHDLLPLLECALLATVHEFQKKERPLCANANLTPTSFLATWLLRNNPRHSETSSQRLADYIANRTELDPIDGDEYVSAEGFEPPGVELRSGTW